MPIQAQTFKTSATVKTNWYCSLLNYIINQVLQHQGRLKVVKSGTVVHLIYNLG